MSRLVFADIRALQPGIRWRLFKFDIYTKVNGSEINDK